MVAHQSLTVHQAGVHIHHQIEAVVLQKAILAHKKENKNEKFF